MDTVSDRRARYHRDLSRRMLDLAHLLGTGTVFTRKELFAALGNADPLPEKEVIFARLAGKGHIKRQGINGRYRYNPTLTHRTVAGF